MELRDRAQWRSTAGVSIAVEHTGKAWRRSAMAEHSSAVAEHSGGAHWQSTVAAYSSEAQQQGA